MHEGALTSWEEADGAAFNNTSISYNTNFDAWVPQTSSGGYYYWPANELLSFAAMSPAVLKNNNIDGYDNYSTTSDTAYEYNNTGLEITNFVIADDPSEQYDLLYSEREINQTSEDMQDYGADYYTGIPITFKHALSSIHFSLMTDVSEKVALTKITLRNAKGYGNFKENYNETNKTRNPEWTVNDTRESKSYKSFEGKVEFPSNPQYVSALAAQTGNSSTSHPLLMMPQALTYEKDNNAVDIEIEVNYTVGDDPDVKSRIVKLKDYPKGNPIDKWLPGTKYTYRLVYSTSAHSQDMIYFSPSTDGWVDSNGGKAIEVLL